MRRWEGDGWCLGVIRSANSDKRYRVGGDYVNFWIRYDGEDKDVPHVLLSSQYATTSDADFQSWCLLEER